MGPDYLRELLSPTMTETEAVARDVYQNVLDHLVSGRQLAAIGAGLTDEEVEQLAQHSYAHENQFIKLTLAESAGGRFRLRLHRWYLPDDRDSPNIHNHRFSLISCILRGTMENLVWKLSDDGERYHAFRYLPRLGMDEYLMEYCGLAFLEQSSCQRMEEGLIYSQPATQLHTSHPVTDLVTLFMEDRISLRGYADVFSKRYRPETFCISAPALDASRYRSTLMDVLAMI